MTLQSDVFFDFQSAHEAPTPLSIFTFPICFKCQMTVEWLMLSSWATFCVVTRGSALMIALGCCQLLMVSPYAPHLQGLSPLRNFLNNHCNVYSLAVPGPNALLMLCVVSAALQPILNLE